MQLVPLQAIPNQQVQVSLANQACTINLVQRSTGLFMDLYVGATLIIAGVICQDRNRIVRDAYLGFTGDFSFADTQGSTDPYYTGLGARYVLVYLDSFDITSS